jgi:hypothetical protein
LSSIPHRLTWPTSAPFRVRADTRIRPVIQEDRRRSRPCFPVSCCLSAAGIRFLGHPVPAGSSAFLTVSAPRHVAVPRVPTGLPCSARARHDRGGCPLYPGTGGVPWPGMGPSTSACRVPAAGPAPRCRFPPAGLTITRHQRGFTCVHPSGLPLRLWHPGGTDALGLDHLSFAPHRYQQRTSGWGQAIEH